MEPKGKQIMLGLAITPKKSSGNQAYHHNC